MTPGAMGAPPPRTPPSGTREHRVIQPATNVYRCIPCSRYVRRVEGEEQIAWRERLSSFLRTHPDAQQDSANGLLTEIDSLRRFVDE